MVVATVVTACDWFSMSVSCATRMLTAASTQHQSGYQLRQKQDQLCPIVMMMIIHHVRHGRQDNHALQEVRKAIVPCKKWRGNRSGLESCVPETSWPHDAGLQVSHHTLLALHKRFVGQHIESTCLQGQSMHVHACTVSDL
jgi:hypothetical protein